MYDTYRTVPKIFPFSFSIPLKSIYTSVLINCHVFNGIHEFISLSQLLKCDVLIIYI